MAKKDIGYPTYGKQELENIYGLKIKINVLHGLIMMVKERQLRSLIKILIGQIDFIEE